MGNQKYPRKGEWRPPKKKTVRQCLTCQSKQAGILFIQFDWFRGDDEGYAVCGSCKNRKSINEIIVAAERKEKEVNDE